MSSREYRRDGIIHVFASLNCNGSEDHLKMCNHSAFFENLRCYTMATVVCKGMWKHKHYMIEIPFGKIIDVESRKTLCKDGANTHITLTILM